MLQQALIKEWEVRMKLKKFNTLFIKIAITAIFFILINSDTFSAETNELKLDITEDYTNAVFSIVWENAEQEAGVELSAPSGTIYNSVNTPDAVYEAKGEAFVNVGQAEKGTWTIRVTGDNLGKIDVYAGQLPGSLVIDSFTVSQNADHFDASYAVSDCPETLTIEIFADRDKEGYDGERVYNGTGNASGTVSFNMDTLGGGEYHFYIRVSADEAYKRKYADAIISYQNPNLKEKVNGVKGGKYNDGYYISWEKESENSDYGAYTVYVWDENLNLNIEEELEGQGFYYQDFQEGETKVYLAVVKKGSPCNYDRIEVLKTTEVSASVNYDADENVTSHTYITADVGFDGNAAFDAFLNGEIILENEKEAGTYKVDLSEGDNEVIFCVTDEQGNVKEFLKNIYVDTIAPALSVSEDIHNLTTAQNYIYISGYSEAGATLTLNGKPVEMTQGYFNEKANLSLGENTIQLEAVDGAGNKSVYTALVKYQLNKKSKLELIIVMGVVLILFIVYLFVFIKGIRRRKKE